MTFWDSFWLWADTSPLGSNVVGGLVVAGFATGIGTILTLTVKGWRGRIWGGLFKGLRTVRLTTSTRQENTKNEAYAKGMSAQQTKFDAQRVQPLNPPRWNIVHAPNLGRTAYILANHADDCSAKHVRLDARPEEFTFTSAASWDGVSGKKAVRFEGHVSEGGRQYGVDFEVHWVDAHRAMQVSHARLDRSSSWS